jgi:hypothetical protein
MLVRGRLPYWLKSGNQSYLQSWLSPFINQFIIESRSKVASFSRVSPVSQIVLSASRQHFEACLLFSLPRYARGHAPTRGPRRGPPVLRRPNRVRAASASSFETLEPKITSVGAKLSVRCSTLEPDQPVDCFHPRRLQRVSRFDTGGAPADI